VRAYRDASVAESEGVAPLFCTAPSFLYRHARWGRSYFQQFFGATGVVDQTRLAVGRRTGDATSRVRVKEHGLVLCLPVGQAYPSASGFGSTLFLGLPVEVRVIDTMR
jgi:hypothetical protein